VDATQDVKEENTKSKVPQNRLLVQAFVTDINKSISGKVLFSNWYISDLKVHCHKIVDEIRP
jgi:hypothetical protein